MRKDNPGASMEDGVGDDLLERKLGTGLIAGMMRHVHAARFLIDMRDEQTFQPRVRIPQAAGEEGFGGCQAVQSKSDLRMMKMHCSRIGGATSRSYRNRVRNGRYLIRAVYLHPLGRLPEPV